MDAHQQMPDGHQHFMGNLHQVNFAATLCSIGSQMR
jgi:hypothetical protein